MESLVTPAELSSDEQHRERSWLGADMAVPAVWSSRTGDPVLPVDTTDVSELA